MLYVVFNLSMCLSLFPQPTHLANFNQVQSIQYSALEEKDRKGMLQLNVAGAPEVKYTPIHYSTGFSIDGWFFVEPYLLSGICILRVG